MIRVFPIKTGYAFAYLVSEDNKWLMVDTGVAGKEKSILLQLNSLNLNPEDLSLIVITHAHYDHVGNLKWLKDVSHAPVVIHELERIILETGDKAVPSGTIPFTRLLSQLGKWLYPKKMFSPVSPDLTIQNTTVLSDFGFSGVLIPTPGHTSGSVSLLFGSGEAFVGDTCFFAFGRKTVFPVFANDTASLMKSWETLLDSEAKIFYPGHGKSFNAETLKNSFEMMKK